MKRSFYITLAVLVLLVAPIGIFPFTSTFASSGDSWVWVGDTVTGAYGEAVVGTGNAIYIARKNSF